MDAIKKQAGVPVFCYYTPPGFTFDRLVKRTGMAPAQCLELQKAKNLILMLSKTFSLNTGIES